MTVDPGAMFEPLPKGGAVNGHAGIVKPGAWTPICPVPDDAPPPPPLRGTLRHRYTDASGATVAFVDRIDEPVGKSFLPWTYCRNSHGRFAWCNQAPPAPRPFYGLDRLAANPAAPVLVVEGEKKADAAQRLFADHVAVATSGGSNAAAKSDFSLVNGRHVTIWPDNDKAGTGYAATVADLAKQAGAASVAIVDVPAEWRNSKGKAWDLADRPPDGVTAETLRSMVEAARPVARLAIASAVTSKRELPEPLPLPKLPAVPDFPLGLLPDVLQPYIRDAAERARFRADFAAVAIMSALGAVIGRKVGIRLKQQDDWTEYGNVWGAMIGLPSSLKSPAMREALRPFKALQVDADRTHEKEAAVYAKRAEEFKLRKEAAKKAKVRELVNNSDAEIDFSDHIEPVPPVPRTYWTSNATGAKLGELLAANPNGLLIERDELSSLLVELEDERNADLRGLFLSGWSGKEGYRFDRIGRGTTALPKFALSVCGGIQPGPLSQYVRNAFSGERADGLLQRFQLAVWPDPETFEYVDRLPDGNARMAAAELFEHCDTFDPASIGTRDMFGDDPPFIRFSPAAQELFADWYTKFMAESRRPVAAGGEGGPIAAHFGKYPGLVGKLALNLHVADDPTATEVSSTTLLKALGWIEYLTPHARRLYFAVGHPETGAAEILLARLRRGDLPTSFKAWEITRKGWHGLTDNEAVKKACRMLFEHGWLIEIPSTASSVGRPPDPVYQVSPAVKPGGAL